MKQGMHCAVFVASILTLSTANTLASDQATYDIDTGKLTLPSTAAQGATWALPGRGARA